MVTHTVQSLEMSRAVIQRLIEKGTPEAIHNSAYRDYPPRCHEETRQSIRADIVSWVLNLKRLRRMRWYWGPAGVGKSAIAQSVAETPALAGYLGGTYFFSRPGKIDDPDTVIPTLAYQLAMKIDRYKRLITEALGSDPLILSMNRKSQFQALIIEPFRKIALETAIRQPFLVIIDGLDECRDQRAQCELLMLIRNEVEREDESPLVWMICSRPEWHLRALLANVDQAFPCQKIEISIDDGEAQRDARRILHSGLNEIRVEYDLSEDWPPQEQLDLIFDAARGHLGFISFILRFLKDDTDSDGPSEQFRLCVKAAKGRGITSGAPNPLEALDFLYRQILSGVPSKHWPYTTWILGISILYSGHQLSIRGFAGFLTIPQDSIYQDSNRSLEFCLDDSSIHHQVAIRSLSFLGRDYCDERAFAESVVWDACRKVPVEHIPDIIYNLKQFDFGNLELPQSMHISFANFLRWLYAQLPDDPSLISLVDEFPEHVSHRLDIGVTSNNPMEFCEIFPSEFIKSLPEVTVHLIVGFATQVHISLVVGKIVAISGLSIGDDDDGLYGLSDFTIADFEFFDRPNE
ncbi:hypothetical protein NP233_g11465 [Leucocoprinus birnbaumii]|uniref:Nephrocystin 3-like N-terminal domain-containing protein n=1 Tax=Leucocoprinus birnbaumii TaxID=56174 RepID=A0AAD5VK34_9AGAR|nr:hypothetical protein NP233_g11465 [Leucocoprinus birnbaumii]